MMIMMIDAGVIHQVRFWNRDLTADEVKMLMDSDLFHQSDSLEPDPFALGGWQEDIASDETDTAEKR